MKKKTLILIMLIVLSMVGLTAAPYYDYGSQIFTIYVGTYFPITATNTERTAVGLGGTEKGTNFSVGGYGSIDYEVFLNPYLAIGGELGYQFNFIGDGNVFSEVPILFKLSYVPLQGNVEIPISLGLGLNYMSYNDNSKLCMMAELIVGVRYFFTESWGLGITSGITFTPELYSDSSKNGMLTFVPINVAVSYRH